MKKLQILGSHPNAAVRDDMARCYGVLTKHVDQMKLVQQQGPWQIQVVLPQHFRRLNPHD